MKAHGIDLSKYDLSFDPDKATKPIDFVIQRASYGLTKDQAYDTLLPGVLKTPIRMAYHYLSSSASYQSQVDKFLSVVGNTDFHAYAADFEEYYNTMSVDFALLAWNFIKEVAIRTGKRVLLYTNPDKYNLFIRPSGTRFGLNWNQVDLWLANWLNNPGLNPELPVGRTSWDIWQYENSKTDGLEYGIGRTTIDLNVFNGTVYQMRSWLGLSGEELLFPGVVQRYGVKNGWKWWLQEVDTSKAWYEIVNLSGIASVSSVARAYGAQIGWNGSDYNRTTLELNDTGSLALIRLPSGEIEISRRRPEGAQMVYAVRPLIENGVINPRLYETDEAATEGHSRHIFGKTAEGKILHLISEGVFPNQGLLLREGAEIMLENGAIIAGDTGGGGDVTLVENGQVINLTENIYNGVHFERPIPQVLLLHTQGDSEMTYGTAQEKLGNTSTVRTSPSRYGRDTGLRIQPHDIIEFVEVVPAVVSGTADNANDKWFKLPTGNYVNYILSGLAMYTILTEPSIPPVTQNPKVTITFTHEGVVYEAVDVELTRRA